MINVYTDLTDLMVYIIRIYYWMNSDKPIGKRGLMLKDVEKIHNGFGKPVYLVTKQGF